MGGHCVSKAGAVYSTAGGTTKIIVDHILTPWRYKSGEVSRNGRVSKRGDKLTQPTSTRRPTSS